jgi:hypothetical protein
LSIGQSLQVPGNAAHTPSSTERRSVDSVLMIDCGDNASVADNEELSLSEGL